MLSKESEGLDDNGGEWTEASWKKSRDGSAQPKITSYYVSNLPDRIWKLKIQKAFEEFGKIFGIYIGGKRDRSGSIFAFVKFEGVADAKVLEKEMSGVKCEDNILKVNIARHQKQKDFGAA